jgi:hypothetical protein
MMDDATTQGRARGSRIVASLIIVLLAAGIFAGACLRWSAASAALPKSMFSSGSLAFVGGALLLDAHQLAPGQSVTGSVVLANEGASPGRFALRVRALVDSPGVGGGSLARTLRLVVTDVTAAGARRCLYEGSPAGLGAVDVGSLASGETRSVRVTMSFPRRPVGGAEFAGSTLSFAFAWSAVTTG